MNPCPTCGTSRKRQFRKGGAYNGFKPCPCCNTKKMCKVCGVLPRRPTGFNCLSCKRKESKSWDISNPGKRVAEALKKKREDACAGNLDWAKHVIRSMRRTNAIVNIDPEALVLARKRWDAAGQLCQCCGVRCWWPNQAGHRKMSNDAACVDHRHTTGLFRGLVCMFCNLRVIPGLDIKGPDILDRAKAYVFNRSLTPTNTIYQRPKHQSSRQSSTS